MATKRWIGAAGKARQLDTITMAGAFASTNTVTIVIGGSTLVCTVGTPTATTDVANLVAAAFNAENATAGLVSDETRNVGGQALPEFKGLTADASGSVVTITGLLGIPFTMVVTETAAGDATEATAQAATGPHHFDDAANWDGGVIPGDQDTVEFSSGSVDCKYALATMVTGTDEFNLLVTTDYTGRIGLPAWRTAADNTEGSYTEYRDRYLGGYDVGATMEIRITTGNFGGPGGITMLDLDDFAGGDIIIDDPGTVKTEPSVQLYGGASTSFYIGGGWVAVDPRESPVATGHELDGLVLGSKQGSGDPLVNLGEDTLFDGAITGTVNAGTLEVQTILDQGADEMALVLEGGVAESKRAQAHAAVTIKEGATYKWSGSGTAAGVIAIWTGGTLDLRGSGETQTYAGGVTMFGGSTLRKGGHTVAPSYSGCNEFQVTVSD